jgi:GDP-4-dehydro-6-deoxy-D-mannose reductase
MERYLITGFSGFVSRHFLGFLDAAGNAAEVLGVDLMAPAFDIGGFSHIRSSFERVDLLDRNQVGNIIYQFKPDYILHLASYSSVAYSWKDPVTSFQNNTNIFLHLLEKIRALELECRILSIGSSEEYGNVSENDVPLAETHPLSPVSPYAVARVSQEMLSRIYVEGYGLNIVMTRSFNHIGPWQRDLFAVASFARQLVEYKKKGAREGDLQTGDVSIIRDFIDVRDVVAAYYKLFKKGRRGEVYNICSGRRASLREVIGILSDITGVRAHIQLNEKMIRPSDNRVIVGSNTRAVSELDWEPRYTLEQSLRDIVAFWETML